MPPGPPTAIVTMPSSMRSILTLRRNAPVRTCGGVHGNDGGGYESLMDDWICSTASDAASVSPRVMDGRMSSGRESKDSLSRSRPSTRTVKETIENARDGLASLTTRLLIRLKAYPGNNGMDSGLLRHMLLVIH